MQRPSGSQPCGPWVSGNRRHTRGWRGAIALGILPALGAWLLVIFLVAAAVTMHAFWREQDEHARQAQTVQFLKNLALAGAALMVSAVDEWRWAIWDNQWPVG